MIVSASDTAFYTVAATTIPVLYIVVAFQSRALAEIANEPSSPLARLFEWMANWNLIRPALGSLYGVLIVLYCTLPLAAVAMSIYALMADSDAPWMRGFVFAGVVVVLLLLVIAMVAAYGDAERSLRPGAHDELVPRRRS